MSAPGPWAAATASGGPGCERVTGGALDEPVAALSSLAFVVAGAVIWLLARRRERRGGPGAAAPRGDGAAGVGGYAVLVAAVGVGSFVQHGPDPAWSDVAHDLPLLATLAHVGADAAADLTGRARRWWSWALPVVALLPLVVLAPRAGDLAQVGVAVLAVTLTVLRAVARPDLRRTTAVALGLLALGATVGTLSRAGWPWCAPASPWQGHAAWHVLAATALTVLAPVLAPVPASVPNREAPDGDPRG